MSTFLQHCRRHAAAVMACSLALTAPLAWAAGTPSDTSISNNAQLTYQVGGVTQNVQSNTATFKVDNLVRLQVSETNSAATPVSLGATAQATTFTVTNQGNTTQDYSLATANLTTGTLLTLGSNNYTDAFDGTPCSIYVESNGTPGFQFVSPADTQVNTLSNLAADASATVYVVCNIPTGLANGADAIVSLTATTANAGTCATTCVATQQTNVADDPAAVDVVFGDTNGTDDIVRDGKHSARDAYEVTAALSISKTVVPICDPFNFNVNPKSVPGAYVRYEIQVTNAAGSGQSATLTTITDVLPGAIVFDADLRTGSATACALSDPESAAGSGFKLTCTGGTRGCVGTPVFYTGAGDTDAITAAGQNVTITAGSGPAGNKVLGVEAGYAAGELKPGESITIRFNAIIQ